MNKLKYVRFDRRGVVLFSQSFCHDDFKSLCFGDEILSAAFVAVGENLTVTTYGESVSLGLRNKEGDAREIWKLLNGVDSEGQMMCMELPENAWKDD